MRLERSEVNHESTDKRVGRRCGICKYYRRIHNMQTNMVGQCDKVKGVHKYGDNCNRFVVRPEAVPDWFKLGYSSAAAMAEKSGQSLESDILSG